MKKINIDSVFNGELHYEHDPFSTHHKFLIVSCERLQATTWFEDQADAICLAVNEHKKLTEENKILKGQLFELFEFVSGCSISDYSPDQVDYLADYIIGQMEADNECIEMLKSKIKKLESKR